MIASPHSNHGAIIAHHRTYGGVIYATHRIICVTRGTAEIRVKTGSKRLCVEKGLFSALLDEQKRVVNLSRHGFRAMLTALADKKWLFRGFSCLLCAGSRHKTVVFLHGIAYFLFLHVSRLYPDGTSLQGSNSFYLNPRTCTSILERRTPSRPPPFTRWLPNAVEGG